MAILEKIRRRSLFLILVIGLALFAFVVSPDLFGKGALTTKSNIGKVNGENISRSEFVQKMEEASRRYGASLSTLQLVNQVWNEEVRRKILEGEYEELGIRIEKDQIINVIKSNPAFARDSLFLNEAGVFDEGKFIEFIADLRANNPVGYDQWRLQEEALINSTREQTYFNLIRAGINATLKEGEFNYKSENDKVAIQYVQIPYTSIPDSLITISDEEIKAYANARKKEFEGEDLRAIQYVYFEEKASSDDEKEVKDRITRLLEDQITYNETTKANDTVAGFRSTANVEDFVTRNSDTPFDTTFVAKKNLPAAFADTLFTLQTGETYGPYKDGDYFKISRMMAKKAGGSVKASHILISYKGAERALPTIERSKEEAETKARSVLKDVLKDPDLFAQMAKDNSDGPSAPRGGDLGYFPEGYMVKPFNDFVFNNDVGAIDLVETSFGFHVIKIDDKEDLVQLATVAQEVSASETTINTVFRDATTFEIAVAEKDFSATAAESNYDVRPVRNLKALDENIQGIGIQRGIVQWAFNKDTEIGDVKRFNVSGGYAIVQLTGQTKKGTITNESINTRIRPILLKQKKAAMIIEQNTGKSLRELVSDENNIPLRTASELTMKKLTIPGAGREPRIIGAAFSLNEGETSGLLEGENGVYMVEVTKKETAKPLDNYITYANTQKTISKGKVAALAYNALKEAANIKDNRKDFY